MDALRTVAVVRQLAGGPSGFKDAALGIDAQFNEPFDLAVDLSGYMYVADSKNHRIRMVTPSGAVTTFVGDGTAVHFDGTGTSAKINFPTGISWDRNSATSGALLVAETGGCFIRKITVPGAVMSTVAGSTRGYKDGNGIVSQFNGPLSIASNRAGDTYYVADTGNSRIRKITPTTGAIQVYTLAGDGTKASKDGTGTGAQFGNLIGMSIDSNDNIYVTEDDNRRIRKVTAGGVVTTISGTGEQGYIDGNSSNAQWYSPGKTLGFDQHGNLYVAGSS